MPLVRRVEQGICTNAAGVDEGGTVLTVHSGGADGVQPPTADHRPTATNYRPTAKAVPAPGVRPYGVGTPDIDPHRRQGRAQEEACSTWNGRGPSTGIGGYDPENIAIWR